jgi:hypothetical protein
MHAGTVTRGGEIVRWYSVLILFTSAAVTGLYVASAGTSRLPQQAVRFALTALLLAWLWRGSDVARWILIVLLGLGGLFSLPLVLRGGDAAILGGWLAALYLSFVGFLIGSSHVAAFLASQRGEAVADETGPA